MTSKDKCVQGLVELETQFEWKTIFTNVKKIQHVIDFILILFPKNLPSFESVIEKWILDNLTLEQQQELQIKAKIKSKAITVLTCKEHGLTPTEFSQLSRDVECQIKDSHEEQIEYIKFNKQRAFSEACDDIASIATTNDNADTANDNADNVGDITRGAESIQWLSRIADDVSSKSRHHARLVIAEALSPLTNLKTSAIHCQVDAKQSFEYYSSLVAKHQYMPAYYGLATCFKYGIGTRQCYKRAFEIFQDLLELDPRHPEAHYEMGCFYLSGIKEELKDQADQADQADLKDSKDLKDIIASPKSTTFIILKNLKLALVHFWRAFARGHVEGSYILGYHYFHGIGVEQDYACALKCFQKAARKNFAKAEYMIAACHEYGYGTPKNLYTSVQMYKRASNGPNGSKLAESALIRITKEFVHFGYSTIDNFLNEQESRNFNLYANEKAKIVHVDEI